MTRRRWHRAGSRIVGGGLAWIMLLAAPASRVAGQQDVSQVEDEDIVLPTVVLELDEPTSGGLEVALPVDIQVVTPELWPPLPEASELDIDLRTAVAAPAMEFARGGGEGLADTLAAETYVSIGTTIGEGTTGALNQLDSGLSVLGTGADSDFSLAFTHSLRDGVRLHRRPGEGANAQRYAVSGSVALGGQFDAEASMVNSEQGFGALCKEGDASKVCGEANYEPGPVDESERRNSAESQAVAVAASYRIPLGDRLQLTPAVDAQAAATTLTGRNAETHSELSAAPELVLDWDLEPVDLQIRGRYLVRSYEELGRFSDDKSSFIRHKGQADVTGSVDLGGQMGLELSLGWSYRNDENAQEQFGGNRFVPQAAVSGTPASWFTFRLAGGFEVRELGVASITERYRYVEPDRVYDDDGWFAFARAQFGLGELVGLSELAVVATTRLATHSAALTPTAEPNARNLYGLQQREVGLSVVPGLGLNVGFGEVLEIRANVSGELMEDAPEFAPNLRSELEVEAYTADGGLGVRLNAALDSVPALGGLQVPEVDIEGLWRQGPTTITLGLTDILEIANSPRKDWAPYLRPGFGAAVSVQLAL